MINVGGDLKDQKVLVGADKGMDHLHGATYPY